MIAADGRPQIRTDPAWPEISRSIIGGIRAHAVILAVWWEEAQRQWNHLWWVRLDQIFDHPPLYFGRVDDVTNALLPVHAKGVHGWYDSSTIEGTEAALSSRPVVMGHVTDVPRAMTGRAAAPQCSHRICSGRQLDLHRMYAAKAG